MAKKIKGITIEIGGNVQPLNKALESANKKSRDLQSELRQVDRLLKLDPKNTELLTQKQKLLADAISSTKEKLDTLKEAERQVQEQFQRGEVAEEQYRALQREIVATEQKLKGLEKQSKDFGGVFAQQLDIAGKKLQEVGDKIEGAGRKMLPVTGAVLGAGGIAYKMAADLEDAMGATDQIFKDASDSVKRWASELDGYYGIAEGEALEYANMMGTMLINIGGLTEQEAAKQAQALIELAGDLTAMYGGTTQDAVRALTGALKGNNTMLDNYGMAANDALIKTKAMEMGLLKEGEQLTLAAKQAATLALVMEQSAAAQGQAAREAEGASGSLRTVSTEVKNLATDFGTVLLPVITPLIQKVAEFVKWLGSLDDGTKRTIVTIAGIVAAVGPALIIIGNVISAIGTIMTAIKGLIALKKVWTAVQAGLNAVMAANPIALVILAIAALAAAAYVVIKNWEPIKEFFVGLWDGVKEAFSAAWEWIKEMFLKYTPAGLIITHWDKIVSYFVSIKDKIVNVFTKVKDGIVNVWRNIWDGIKGFINKIIDGMNSMIRGLNKLKWDIPDWVPVIGGKKWGINIPLIPKLHTGTEYFMPPNGMREGLALLERGEKVIPRGQAQAPQNVVHSGEITVKGVNDMGQLVGAAQIIIDGMKDPRARLAVDSALAKNLSSALRPAGVMA